MDLQPRSISEHSHGLQGPHDLVPPAGLPSLTSHHPPPCSQPCSHSGFLTVPKKKKKKKKQACSCPRAFAPDAFSTQKAVPPAPDLVGSFESLRSWLTCISFSGHPLPEQTPTFPLYHPVPLSSQHFPRSELSFHLFVCCLCPPTRMHACMLTHRQAGSDSPPFFPFLERGVMQVGC